MLANQTETTYQAPQADLERALIKDYLLSKGYTLAQVKQLPPHLAKPLMTAACRYATLKLAEVESRAKFRQKISYD